MKFGLVLVVSGMVPCAGSRLHDIRAHHHEPGPVRLECEKITVLQQFIFDEHNRAAYSRKEDIR